MCISLDSLNDIEPKGWEKPMVAASEVGTYGMGMSHGWQAAHDSLCTFKNADGEFTCDHVNPYGDPRG